MSPIDYFGLGSYRDAPWRDTMQVCLNGHVTNSSVNSDPEFNKAFCDECGSKTITNCPNCSKPIPGDLQNTGVVVVQTGRRTPPEYCQNCGDAFPWTNKAPKEEHKSNKQDNSITIIKQLFTRFHTLARHLRIRRENRPTLDINDEYDVQDFTRVLLNIFFDDVRTEEWTPSYAGKSSRMDFLIKSQSIVVEAKMTRKGLTEKQLGDELIIDITRYEKHSDCNTLVCFIYDPDGRLANPKGLISDISQNSKENINVIVIVNPL